MAKIEIDGKEFEAKDGATIIEVADENGIHIPRFCYHKKLSVAANCRMCLVDVEKAPKALPACATPVMDGMKVFTKSEKTVDAQKAIMEFLLINHPLDCPVCDQGGQCELQDLAMGYGADNSNFKEIKRAVIDPSLGPLIATDMTRCIHCTRCVRFGAEVAGERELGGAFRGEHLSITTYIKHTVNSELSGNVIDLCPVGALTSKPFRFKARAWELVQSESIAPHDCVGSAVHTGVLRGESLLRVNPKENESINESWISDRDRFGYAGLHHKDRALKPMIKRGNTWVEVDWEQAFAAAVEGLKKAGNQVGALVSPSATTEEMYLLQKIYRQLGSNNIDYRLRQTDFSDQADLPLMMDLGVAIEDIEKRDAILLIGSDVRREQPIIGLKVRKATLKGAEVFAVNPLDFDFNFDLAAKVVIKPSQLVDQIAGIAKAAQELSSQSNNQAAELLKAVDVSVSARQIAKALCEKENASIMLGAFAVNHPYAAVIRQLAHLIAQLTGATVGCLTQGANAQGASIAGCMPHRLAAGKAASDVGKNAKQLLEAAQKAYVLLGVEPEYDGANPEAAMAVMNEADCVIAMTSFVTERMKKYADVILPIASFGETSGTFINVEGKWQSFKGCVKPVGSARPAWKVLRVLGNSLALDGFDYFSSEEVLSELKAKCENVKMDVSIRTLPDSLPKLNVVQLERITQTPIYSVDTLVRHAEPLQQMMADKKLLSAKVNPETAGKLNLVDGQTVTISQDGAQKSLPIVFDQRVPTDCVLIAGAHEAAIGLSASFGAISISV